jgi:hypothetical protein
MRPEILVGIATVVVYSITVIAIFKAPIIALRVQRKHDDEREVKSRKMWIFKTIMSNRATRWNPTCVQALNMIDIEFNHESERAVCDAWKELLDHYNDWGNKTPEQKKIDDKRDLEKANDLLANLLVPMGKSLGYNFDRVYIKKAFYYPEGLLNIEQEQHTLRRAVLNLLSGQGAKLPVAVFSQDFQPLAGRENAPALVPQPDPQLQPALVQQLEDGRRQE